MPLFGGVDAGDGGKLEMNLFDCGVDGVPIIWF